MNNLFTLLVGAAIAWSTWNATVSAQISPRLYVFDCGRLQFESVEDFGISDEDTDVRELADPCYVIEHAEGRLLWNGGLPLALAETEGWVTPQEGVRVRLDQTLSDQLAEMGLTLDDFDYVSFSHMHFDHTGVANDVDHTTVIMQKAEHEAAFADSVTVPTFDPEQYGNLSYQEFLIIEGDHDVFGDGSVRILSTPGHTPGHQSLFLDLEETGSVVLSGDLYHFRISREQRIVPPFNTDAEATLASMDKVEALLEETGAELWIEHEAAHFDSLEKAPAFYE